MTDVLLKTTAKFACMLPAMGGDIWRWVLRAFPRTIHISSRFWLLKQLTNAYCYVYVFMYFALLLSIFLWNDIPGQFDSGTWYRGIITSGDQCSGHTTCITNNCNEHSNEKIPVIYLFARVAFLCICYVA